MTHDRPKLESSTGLESSTELDASTAVPSTGCRPSHRRLPIPFALLLGTLAGCSNGTLGGARVDGRPGGRDAARRDTRPPPRDGSFLPDLALARQDDGGACVPQYTECGQMCGPVYDRCTGRTLQCGGCTETGKVCNLVTHECVTPLTTCSQLGADCGELRNTCGLFVDCGPCLAGKTCNAGTHKCESCPANLKCADLGFECGQVWLGCGARTNKTDCGPCPASEVCNDSLHVCEPRCTPAPKAEICKARGAECGPVSDGCGGMVDCGGCLKAGEQCGISGIANLCSAPPPSVNCISFGYDCLLPGEKLTTACGETVSCGTCPSGQVCRANHKCGPPCTPKTCASPEYTGKCGQQLDDGCGGKLTSCNCAGGGACSTSAAGLVGTCLAIKTCASYAANGGVGDKCSVLGAASKAFPKGDGTFLACLCRVSNGLANNACVDASPPDAQAGTCTCAARVCGSGAAFDCTLDRASNGCGGTLSCSCPGANVYCHQSSKRCCARATCGSGAADEPCGWVKDGCDIDQLCPCAAGTCIVPASLGGPRPIALGEQGICCVFDRAAVCAAASAVPRCRGTNPCDGSAVECCPSGQVCLGDDVTCCQPLTCATAFPGFTGTAGSPCSVGGVADTCGGSFPCNCIGSAVCTVGGRRALPGETGTCCVNAAVCAGSGGEGGPCSVTNTCTGESTSCCGTGLFCDAGTNRCKRLNTCGDYTTGAVGEPCSTVADARFPNGNGGNLRCLCATSGNRDNNTCVGGTCQCSPRTCSASGTFDCRLNGQSDRCGASLSCGCSGSTVCNPTNGQCCSPSQCPAGGVVRGGTCKLTSCGQPEITCGCANSYDKCDATTKKCSCTPRTCVQPDGTRLTGDHPDGCGGVLNCGN